MPEHSYPTSPDDIPVWARERRVPRHEAKTRFVEYAILACVADSPRLRTQIALKGGNALRFVYRSPRSTKDLDFSARSPDFPNDPDQLRGLLDRALRRAHSRFGVKAKCQRVKKNPDREDATRPTYSVSVGYQLPADRYYYSFGERHVSTTIPVEISLFDCVCDTVAHRLQATEQTPLGVCTLEDILAEKLRSLLQQVPRNRSRPQDVYDVALFSRMPDRQFDLAKIGEYLEGKCRIRPELKIAKSSFDCEVRSRAEPGMVQESGVFKP